VHALSGPNHSKKCCSRFRNRTTGRPRALFVAIAAVLRAPPLERLFGFPQTMF
jgi:hypothetical protein